MSKSLIFNVSYVVTLMCIATGMKKPAGIRRVFSDQQIVLCGGGLEALALQALALHLARAAHRFGGFARPALGRLLEMATQLHLAEDPFPLHLLLQRLQRLINIVVTNENLHLAACSISLDCCKRVGQRPLAHTPDQDGAIS